MLPPLSALRAFSRFAPATVVCRRIIAAIAGALIMSGSANAAERLVIGNAIGDQDNAAISISASGGYITWEDNRVQSGKDSKGIAAAAVSAGVQEVGEAFGVSVQKDGRQERPQVVRLSGGGHLFVWEVRNGKSPGIYARVLGTNGAFSANDILVSTPTVKLSQKVSTNWTAPYRGVVKSRKHAFKQLITNTREQAGAASVVPLADGGALVVYHAMRRSDTNSWRLEGRTLFVKSRGEFIDDSILRPYRFGNDWMHDVFMQRVDALGRKMGDEVLVNQSTAFNQRTPSATLLPNGNLVVAWVTEGPASTDWWRNFKVGIVARIFNAEGQPLTDEFAIGGADQYAQANPVLAATVSGGFLICWSQQEAVGRGWDVYSRLFSADGTASGPAFRVNTFTTGEQFGPRIAVAGDDALIVWTSVGQDGSREGVYGRRIRAGALSGAEFRINDTTPSRQWHPAICADGNGAATVVWSGFTGESGFDLFSSSFPLGVAE